MNFSEKVYRLVKKIPKGKVSTYKIISSKLSKKAYRAVGNVLNKNTSKEIPCHRVINYNGFIGGFNKGVKEKIKLLRKEGVKVKKNRVLNFKEVLFKF